MRQFLMIWLGCVLLLSFPSFASGSHAPFTPTERAQVGTWLTAANYMDTGLGNFGLSITNGGVTATTQTLYKSAWSAWYSASTNLDYGLMLLLGGDPDGIDGIYWQTQARSVWVSNVWTNLDAGVTNLNTLSTTLAQIGAVTGLPSAVYTDLTNAKSAVDSAISVFGTVNRTLAYTSFQSANTPRVIGPHGNQDLMLRVFSQSLFSTHQVMLQASNLFDTGEGAYPDYTPFGRIAVRVSNLSTFKHSVLITFDGIAIQPGECLVNKARMILNRSGNALSPFSESTPPYGLPYEFNQFMLDVHGPLVTATVSRPVARGIFITFIQAIQDAWRYSDGAVWHMQGFLFTPGGTVPAEDALSAPAGSQC